MEFREKTGAARVKETGIIMSGDHPRLIIDGLKTMTRRVIKPQPKPYLGYMMNYEKTGAIQCGADYPDTDEDFVECPYGQVGDLLIVKETWATENRYNHLKPSEVPQAAKIWYLADEQYNPQIMGRVRSSMFMCHWMSRANLEITGLRAERLQEITEEDAEFEGCSWSPASNSENPEIISAVENYSILWDSLNAKRVQWQRVGEDGEAALPYYPYSWEVNPWVWPIEFGIVGVRVK